MERELKINLAERLKKHPTIHTVRELSRKSGINQPTLHHLFSGRNTKPRESTIAPLLKIFNCTFEDLVGKKGIKNNQLKINIKNLMIISNFTFSDFIRETKIRSADLDNLLKAKHKYPGDKIIQPICDYFGITLDQLRGHRPIDFEAVKAFINNPEAKANSRKLTYLNRAKETCIETPILSSVQAGAFTEIDRYPPERMFYLPKEWVPHKQCFLLAVKGDSMCHAYDKRAMREDDLVLVDPKKAPYHGAVVIAVKDDEEATVKIYKQTDKKVRLKPLNEKFTHITEYNYCGTECKIVGVVTKIIPEVKNLEGLVV